MPRVYPTREEQTVKIGELVIKKYEDFRKCKKGEWKAFHNAKQITFTTEYITFIDKNGQTYFFSLSEWFVEIYSHDEVINGGLLCRTCGQRLVTIKSKYDEKRHEYYHHEAKCLNCGDKCYPTGVMRFILDHWEETIEANKNYLANLAVRSSEKEDPKQIDIFEYLDTLED